MLPDAKLHKKRLTDEPHIYFRKLLKACRFNYRTASAALGITRRTVVKYANDPMGAYDYATQFYLEARAAMQHEMDNAKGELFSPLKLLS